jgi:uncharacterized protein
VKVVDASAGARRCAVRARLHDGRAHRHGGKAANGDEALAALRALEEYLGRKADYLICIEAGGLNSTIPFAVAAATGLPLLDGDGMGRAFPELQMVSLTLHDIAATPMVIADDKGNSGVLNAISNLWTERLARPVTVEMGGAALVALYPMTGAQMKKGLLHGTLSRWCTRSAARSLPSAR